MYCTNCIGCLSDSKQRIKKSLAVRHMTTSQSITFLSKFVISFVFVTTKDITRIRDPEPDQRLFHTSKDYKCKGSCYLFDQAKTNPHFTCWCERESRWQDVYQIKSLPPLPMLWSPIIVQTLFSKVDQAGKKPLYCNYRERSALLVQTSSKNLEKVRMATATKMKSRPSSLYAWDPDEQK